jgi:hypothetical protein
LSLKPIIEELITSIGHQYIPIYSVATDNAVYSIFANKVEIIIPPSKKSDNVINDLLFSNLFSKVENQNLTDEYLKSLFNSQSFQSIQNRLIVLLGILLSDKSEPNQFKISYSSTFISNNNLMADVIISKTKNKKDDSSGSFSINAFKGNIVKDGINHDITYESKKISKSDQIEYTLKMKSSFLVAKIEKINISELYEIMINAVDSIITEKQLITGEQDE